jgi:hypothetical protein
MGRPAGQALHEFVAAAVDAFMAGFTFDKLSLQLAVNVPNVLPLSSPQAFFHPVLSISSLLQYFWIFCCSSCSHTKS